jgi:hypothetical protein
MGRSLGVANSTADIDGGVISGAAVSGGTVTGSTISGGTATALTSLGTTAAATVGFYGKVPIVQRSFVSSLHNSSAMATSTGSLFQATHVAQIQEIMNTLTALGIWATA